MRAPSRTVAPSDRCSSANQRPEAGAEHARKRRVQRLDDRHLRAEAERRGRRLEPDEAGADHGEPDARRERAAQGERVVERAQHARTLS